MSLKQTSTFLILLLYTIFLLPICSRAASGIMVIRVQGDNIILNRGSSDNIKPDQEFYVHRIGKPVGMIKVLLVDIYSSEAKIIRTEPDESVKIGDIATSEPFSITYTPTPQISKQESSKNSIRASNDYTTELKNHIKIATFRSGPKGSVRVSPGDIWLIYSALGWGSYIPYRDPWMLISIGSSLCNQYRTSQMIGPHLQTTVAVCYYDDELIDAQARYFASKEGITEESQITEIRNGLIQQLGADSFAVFHVKIHNGGDDLIQLAPFKWHIYLIDPSGQKITSPKYDEALDKGLSPGQEVQGYVYFPKFNEMGVSCTGKPVRIRLDSILGGYADLSWK